MPRKIKQHIKRLKKVIKESKSEFAVIVAKRELPRFEQILKNGMDKRKI